MSGRGWALFALMSVIWGIPYLMIKVVVEGVSVPVLVFARTAVGAAVLLPLALRGGGLAGLRPYWRPLAAFAALEIIVPWWLLSDAERHLTSSMTGLLIAASPIVAAVLSRLTANAERLSAVRWAGLAVGLAGVAVLAGPQLHGGAPWPIAEVLLAAACYATAPLIAAHWLRDVPALPMTAACLGLAALVYTPPAAMTWPDALPAGRVLAALAGLAIVCTALAFIVFFALIREVGTSRALVFTYVNPAVAVTAGVLVLNEPLTATILASFALILGGSVLATASQSGDKNETTTASQADGNEATASQAGENETAASQVGDGNEAGAARQAPAPERAPAGC
ncbi:Permease of the drug/metabolite transporter (DMT) superfamily [Thermomonospora echinospora]|uniref:Permease of the drug/metabolite transporter (DMT) superfamily n=1 Tax=Thermomonospora echinospora TaxID=1992 RepID=A0A1H6CDI9_9ACTN|nr:EamA family transporter [Thermomonospora echinospora]SEG70968.1 Permease of the drug/metabolite transporter (DMT) superfamily [Thermomonospora echinospora]